MFYLFLLTSYTLSTFLIAFKTLFNCAILLTSSVNSVNTILSLDTFDDTAIIGVFSAVIVAIMSASNPSLSFENTTTSTL